MFYQLVVNTGKYLPQKGKVQGNNGTYGTHYFRGPFPFEANIYPYEPSADYINSVYASVLIDFCQFYLRLQSQSAISIFFPRSLHTNFIFVMHKHLSTSCKGLLN